MPDRLATGLQIVRVQPATSAPSTVEMELAASFPPSFYLSGARTILDQQKLPCCVSCALATALEVRNPGWRPLAPLFHYFVTRVERLGGPWLVELTIEDAIKAVEHSGICLSQLHPFPMTEQGAFASPSEEARADGKIRRPAPVGVFPAISRFTRLSDPDRHLAWKKALISGQPILAGIEIPAGYDKEMTRAPWPAARVLKTHAVVVIGYSDSEQAFVIQDSRGVEWFQGGQWWMPYSFANSGFVIVAYALRS